MDSFNPYTASAEPPVVQIATPSGMPPGMVPQVPVVAILSMVQGGLEIFGGFIAVFYAVAMPVAMSMPQQGQNAPAPPPQSVVNTLMIGGAVYAVVLFGLGGARIYAGIKMLSYRSYVFAMATLMSGLVMLFTCYCFPTALLLAIYGMILLLNPSVKHAFDLAREGRTPQQVRAMFGMIG